MTAVRATPSYRWCRIIYTLQELVMGPLPPTIIQSMSSFAPLFSARVWPHAQVLLTGAILAPGKRTVRALLRVMGLDHRSDKPITGCSIAASGPVLKAAGGCCRYCWLRLPPAAGWFLAWTIRLSVAEAITLQPRVSLAHTLIKKTACSVRQTAWYSKTKPTFSDALAWVRKHIWHHFSTSTPHPDRQKPTAGILQRLIDIVCYAT